MALSVKTRFLVLKRDDYRCRLCGRTAEQGARLEVDHKLAISNGGTDHLDNLWVLCFECNHGKLDLYLDKDLTKTRGVNLSSKRRIVLMLSAEEVKELEALAKSDRRTLSNQIHYILVQHLRKLKQVA